MVVLLFIIPHTTIEIDSHISSKLNINCGVPQGFFLGPLLFLLYINDIQYCSSKLQCFPFADKTNVLFAHKGLKTVNVELHSLYNWPTSNELSLNIKRTNCKFSSIQKKKKKKKKLNCDPQVNGVDNKMKKYKGYIESKNFIPYLGLSIDENLSWKTHIHSVANKISK